jgi:hypothetical protein
VTAGFAAFALPGGGGSYVDGFRAIMLVAAGLAVASSLAAVALVE